MGRTTIAIQTATRARLRRGAAHDGETIDGFLRSLLDEYERSQFWDSFSDLTPQAYVAATGADGDGLDEGYAVEDREL